MIQALLGGVAYVVTRRPRAVLVGLGLVTLFAALLLPRLRIDPDVTAFLPRGDPRVALLTDDAVTGAAGRRLWIALERDDAGEHVEELADSLRALPGVQRVLARREALLGTERELPNLGHLSEDSLAALETRLEPAARRAAIADIRRTLAEDPLGGQERALRDPLGLRWIFDEQQAALPVALDVASPHLVLADGSLAILALEGERKPFDVAFSTALVGRVEDVLRGFGYEPGSSAHVVGGYAVARGDAARIRGDLLRSLLWSVPLIVLFLTLSSRSFVLPHLYVLPVLVSITWALGFGGALFGALTPLALSSAAILTGLGVDFAIHLSERWREERAVGDAIHAVRVSTLQTGRGLVVGMLTSAAAFLSFATSSLPGLVSFGGLLALGLASALVVTLLLEPLLLERFARGKMRAVEPPASGPVVRAALRLACGRGGVTAAAGLVLMGLAGWGVVSVRGLVFDADPSALRPDDTGIARATAAIRTRLSFSPIAVRVLIPEHVSGGHDAAVDAIAAGAERLEKIGEAALVIGPHGVLPTAAKRASLERLSARGRTLVEEAALDLEAEGLRAEAFREGLADLAARLTEAPAEDAPGFRVVQARESGDSKYWRVDVYATGDLGDPTRRARLREELANAFGDDALVADPHGIGDAVTPVLRRELAQALLEAAGLVVLCVMLTLGGARRGLIAMVPVVLGFGITLGVLSLLDVALTPGNLMAIPLVLGLGVDDGVHLVLRHAEGRGALAATGNAIWRTSATTALGFGSLVTAKTPAIASLGAITLIGVAATLVTSLIVLPAFWSRTDARATKKA